MKTEKEIVEIPPLAPGEQSLLSMHSILNVLNVLRGELMMLGLAADDDPNLFWESLAACDRFRGELADPVAARAQLAAVTKLERQVMDTVYDEARCPQVFQRYNDLELARSNLRAVFHLLRVRAHELLARTELGGKWYRFSLQRLRRNLVEFFLAQQAVTRKGYRIVTDVGRQQPSDYCITLGIYSQNGMDVTMPPELEDVFRDLIANARKYSPPGSRILANLVEEPAHLRLEVDDLGRGIPPGEIEEVVHFGKRATNVDAVRTLGGGFGLTKAFYVTKQHGGRFWIASELGAGTTVRLRIPRPV